MSSDRRRRTQARGWQVERRDAIYAPVLRTSAPSVRRLFLESRSEPVLATRGETLVRLSAGPTDPAGEATRATELQPSTRPGTAHPSTNPDIVRSSATHRTELDTARAYEMLRTSASLAVPLLCLATKG